MCINITMYVSMCVCVCVLQPVSTPGQVFNISASSSFFSLREFFSENLEIIFSVSSLSNGRGLV